MTIEITNEKKNPLLGRKEVGFSLTSKITPSREAIKAELSKVLKTKEEFVVIDLVDQKTGSNVTTGKAKVYENSEVMAKVELEYKSKRGVKEKKEESAPTPEPAPTEAPATEEKPSKEAPIGPVADEKPPEEAPVEASVDEKPEEKSE